MTPRPIAEDDLHAYVDDLLDASRRSEVEAYLADHPDVARRVGAYARYSQSLRQALAPSAETPIPPSLNLERMIVARREALTRVWRTATATAAAVVLVVTGGIGGWLLRGAALPPQNGIASLAQEAAESYAVYGPDHLHPVEFTAANRSDLMQWVVRRIGAPVAAPDLSASGYRFMGGRLVATQHGPAALFMYDDDRGTRLVLLVRTMARKDKNAPVSQFDQDDASGFAWAVNGVGYSLTGPVRLPTLRLLADEAQRQTKS